MQKNEMQIAMSSLFKMHEEGQGGARRHTVVVVVCVCVCVFHAHFSATAKN